MSTVDRIQTRHPDPAKAGANFDAAKSWAVREAILRAAPATGGGLRFADLPTRVAPRLSARAIPGGGSIGWYVTPSSSTSKPAASSPASPAPRRGAFSAPPRSVRVCAGIDRNAPGPGPLFL